MIQEWLYTHWVLVGVGVIATITDLWRRKIYNWLTLPAILLGLILSTVQSGPWGLLDSFLGFLLAGTLYMILGLIGAMKGGDVKLAAAVGALLGWRLSISALYYGAILGGIFALFWSLYHGTLFKTLQRVWRALYAAAAPGMRPEVELQHSDTEPMPYGVAISWGAIATLFWLPPVL
ncbi:MAG: prepilin peptidase [Candidatus Sericytochromatia bacterium]|nr:prepilin peptidase [Candidatus Sericytochromatia bacterium]